MPNYGAKLQNRWNCFNSFVPVVGHVVAENSLLISSLIKVLLLAGTSHIVHHRKYSDGKR